MWYCNVTCQKAHRKAHRKECKRIEEERKKADAVAAVAGGNVLNSNQEKGAATKLICAPCWICLEEGPDEAGEPLVRNCSCRGETSAGYHISCLINYAKSKTQRLIERSIELNDFNSMKSTWLLCPNCSGPYFGSVGNRMADAVMETTQHLPYTHWVRYEALTSSVEQRILILSQNVVFPCSDSQAYTPPFNEIDTLIRVTEEETSALLLSMHKQLPEREMIVFRASTVSSLLLKKGRLLNVIGEKEEALCCFETANAKLIAAALTGLMIDKEVSFQVRSQLHRHKVEMGLTTPADDVKQLREDLAYRTAPYDQIRIKVNLARALTELDPPEYFEAIRLQGEVVAETKLMHGPEHNLFLSNERLLAKVKEEYRAYLKSVASKK